MARDFAKMDDGFQADFIQNASLDGSLEMPAIDAEKEIIIPKVLVPYSQVLKCSEKDKFCIFNEHDINFSEVVRNPESDGCLKRLNMCIGVASPDCSVAINAPILVQLLNIYRSRAIGAKFQSMGFYTIPNLRWGDERTYTTKLFPEPPAFLGIPKNSMVLIGSHGACKNAEIRKHFRAGLVEALKYLKPRIVLVYGPMPKAIFDSLIGKTQFIRYDDWTTYRHGGRKDGHD